MSNISGIVKSARKIMRQDIGTGSDELRILQLGWMLFLKIFSDKDKELELIQEGYKSPIPAELHWDQWAGDDEGMTGDELLKFVDQKLFPTLSSIDLSTGNKRAVLVHGVFANNYNYMKSGIHLRQVINKLNAIDFNNSKDKQIFGEIYETFLGELQSAGTLGEFYTPRAITELLAELTDPKPGEKVLDPACGTGGYLTAALEHLKAKATKTVWYYQHQLPKGYKAYSKTRPIQLSEFDEVKKWWKKREESEIAWKVDIKRIKESGYNLDIKNPHQPEEEKQHTAAELLEMLHRSFAKGTRLVQQLKEEY